MMTGIYLPDRVDVYRANGSGLTLMGTNLPGYVERMSAGARNGLRAVSTKPLATLWLGLEARAILQQGAQIYWRERDEWWTIQGKPVVLSQSPGAHLEAIITANLPDRLFEEAQPAIPLSFSFTGAETMTGVRLDIATNADFSETILTASSVVNATGWVFAIGSQWMRLPVAGLPPQSLQTVAYIPALELPRGNYFTRWTPFYGSMAGVGMAAQVAL